jgi:hypothetical protein
MVRVWGRGRRAVLSHTARFAGFRSVHGRDRWPGLCPKSVTGKQNPRAAPWHARHALSYGHQECAGNFAMHNCQFATRDGTRRVPAVLRGIAALLHFVATGKNRSGKAFDGQ